MVTHGTAVFGTSKFKVVPLFYTLPPVQTKPFIAACREICARHTETSSSSSARAVYLNTSV